MRYSVYSVLALPLIVAATAWGCGAGTASSPSTPSAISHFNNPVLVDITDPAGPTALSPAVATATSADVIQWYNVSTSTEHHIVMDDGSFDSGDIDPELYSPRMPAVSGTYHCTFHPNEVGSIKVQ